MANYRHHPEATAFRTLYRTLLGQFRSSSAVQDELVARGILDQDDIVPEKQLRKIRNQIEAYSTPFHDLVEVLFFDRSTSYIGQSMLMEYYVSSISEHRLVVNAISKRKSTNSYTNTQTLRVELQQSRNKKHEYVRLLLDTPGDSYAVLQERDVAFVIAHTRPPDISLAVAKVAYRGCQLELVIEWREPHLQFRSQNHTVEFFVKGLCNHTGFLHPQNTKWNSIKCSHTLPRIQDELPLPKEVSKLFLVYTG